MTLGVLSPYRRQGLASMLVKHVIKEAEASLAEVAAGAEKEEKKDDAAVTSKKVKVNGVSKEKEDDKEKEEKKEENEVEVVKPRARVESLYLHVQVSNGEARRFWEKNGFQVTVRCVSLSLSFLAFVPPPAAPPAFELGSHLLLGPSQATIQNYYRKIEPRDAWVLERKIVASA